MERVATGSCQSDGSGTGCFVRRSRHSASPSSSVSHASRPIASSRWEIVDFPAPGMPLMATSTAVDRRLGQPAAGSIEVAQQSDLGAVVDELSVLVQDVVGDRVLL